MKKMIAVLMTVALVVTAAAALAENAPFSVKEGVTLGMSQNDLIAALGGERYEIENERTRGGFSFVEVEVENTTVNGLPADVKYVLGGDQLVGVHVDYAERAVSYDEVKAPLTAAFGESVPLDPSSLGKAIFAADDDGYLEGAAECWKSGDVVMILEKEHDGDVDLYTIDTGAPILK